MNIKESDRMTELDWLRVIAVLLLIPFHGALIFNQDPQAIVYLKDIRHSNFLTTMAGFIHIWHMPLLFFIAGASARFALKKRGTNGFLKERVRKLFLPLMAGLLTVIPAMTYISRLSQGWEGTYGEHFIGFFTSFGNLTGLDGSFTPAHLWFLLYLLFFSLAGIPLFKENGGTIRIQLWLSEKYRAYILLFPLVLIAAIPLLGDKNPLYYFSIYYLGFLFSGNKELYKSLSSGKITSLILGILTTTLFFMISGNTSGSVIYYIRAILFHMSRIFWLFAILGFAQALLNQSSDLLRFLSRLSFPLYILHLPVLTFLTYIIRNITVPIWGKYLFLVISTGMICLVLNLRGFAMNRKKQNGTLVILTLLLTLLSWSCKSYTSEVWAPDAATDKTSLSAEDLLVSHNNITVTPLQSGTLRVPLSGAINLEHPLCSDMSDRELDVPIYAYLLHHEQYGFFLIDTGCASSYKENPYGPMEGFLATRTMVPTSLKENRNIAALLEPYLTTIDKLKGVFLTHMHYDHTSGLPELPEDLLLIAGKGEASYQIPLLIEPHHFQKNRVIQFIDFAKDYALDSPLGKVVDLMGDGSIWAVSTPGHSEGHISYLVNSSDGPVFIAGDASILNLGMELGVGPGTFCINIEKAQKTLDIIRSFIQEYPQIQVWSGHDVPEIR